MLGRVVCLWFFKNLKILACLFLFCAIFFLRVPFENFLKRRHFVGWCDRVLLNYASIPRFQPFMALLPACSLFAFTTIVSLPLASLKPFAKLIWFTPPLERHKLVMMKFSFKNKVGNDSESRLEITLFHKKNVKNDFVDLWTSAKGNCWEPVSP